MLGSFTRRKLFWILDALNGGRVKEHLRDIGKKNQLENYDYTQLNKVIHHANLTVPFYHKHDYYNLNEFPIIKKADLKQDYNSFISRSFIDKRFHEMSTSGSSGIPFVIKQDFNKRKRVISELIYFNQLENLMLGDRFMRLKTFPQKKSILEKAIKNFITIDVLKIDKEVLELIRKTLKKDKMIRYIYGYASAFEQLANFLYDAGDKPYMFCLKGIFSSSALLNENTKRKLNSIFGCKIIDRYSNQENGVLAQTRETYGCFYINKASYYIELLKINSDESAEKGELGRIIVTDLYNYFMPIIRYDTGDLAIVFANDK